MKNDPNKQRKVVVQYVELCGNKKGDNQHSMCDNRISLDEIAKQLGTSKRTLQELLEIERKLTPGIISNKFLGLFIDKEELLSLDY